jgi:hypothetical protein
MVHRGPRLRLRRADQRLQISNGTGYVGQVGAQIGVTNVGPIKILFLRGSDAAIRELRPAKHGRTLADHLVSVLG